MTVLHEENGDKQEEEEEGKEEKTEGGCFCAENMQKAYRGAVSRLKAIRKAYRRSVRIRPLGKRMPSLLPQPFPTTENVAAGQPTKFWSPSLRQLPLPTNTAWLNFVLNEGSVPEYLHPYLIQVENGALNLCYPNRIVDSSFIIQAFVPNLTIRGSSSNPMRNHCVTSFDDLSVTLELPGHITAPLVRGCPYVTFIFKESVVPAFSTIHAVLDLKSNETRTKHKISMNNGQTWLMYSSESLCLSPSLAVEHEFKGVLRVAYLNGNDETESILDRFSSTYPLEGHAVISAPFEITYRWAKNNPGDLIMLSLPMHRELMTFPDCQCICSSLSYNSIDGEMQGVVSDAWVMREDPVAVGWHSLKGIADEDRRREIFDALNQDIAQWNAITTDSTYFHGKALARLARIALIAEEVKCLDVLQMATDFLKSSVTPWMEGNFGGNALLYDSTWGGLISQNGLNNPGADFGLGVYNDHHYHMGYFCYAGAVLAKLDPAWGTAYKAHLYTIAEDFMTMNHHLKQNNSVLPQSSGIARKSPLFPRFRNFDFWVLHSWAGGLTEFLDGRNQESTSEAVNAYYSASLLGRAFKDNCLVDMGLTLAAFEIRAAQTLWHVPRNSSLYESVFVSRNRMLGVLWANKRDTGLWFAPPEWKECRLGIQLLPIVPITEFLFKDLDFVKDLVEWASTSLSRPDVKDEWKGFIYALQALYAPNEALNNVTALREHDDGNSLSNLLWWVHSR